MKQNEKGADTTAIEPVEPAKKGLHPIFEGDPWNHMKLTQWLAYPVYMDEFGGAKIDLDSPFIAKAIHNEAPRNIFDSDIESLKKEIQVLKDEKEKLIKSLKDDREFLKEEKASNEERLKKGLRI